MSKVPAPPFVRNPYNYDSQKASQLSALVCDDPSLAQQQFKETSDPNYIYQQFVRTRDESLLNVRTWNSGDFTGITSYQDALNRVLDIDDQFAALPAEVRSRFQNDPAQLLNFVADDRNFEEARSLGLLKPDVTEGERDRPSSGQARTPSGGRTEDPQSFRSIPAGYKLVPDEFGEEPATPVAEGSKPSSARKR